MSGDPAGPTSSAPQAEEDPKRAARLPGPSPRRRLLLALASFCSLGLSFFTFWYVLVRLGVGDESDALFASLVVPQFVLTVGAAGLSHVLVPLFASEEEEGFASAVWTLLGATFLGFAALTGLLAASASLWAPLLFPGFSERALELAIALARVQLLGALLSTSNVVLGAAHHARGRFLYAELIPLATGLAGLAFLLLSFSRLGVHAAAWVTPLRSLLGLPFLLAGLRLGRPSLGRSDARRLAWSRLRPLIAGNAFYKTDPFVDQFLASLAAGGALTLLALANRLFAAASQVISSAVAVPLVPSLAREAKAQAWERFRSIYRRGALISLTLTGAGYLVLLVAGQLLLRLLIGHGGVSEDSVYDLWLLCVCLGGVWAGACLGQIFASSFYAQGETTLPTRIGVVGYSLGVALKIVGFLQFGILGIAIGTSSYYLFNALVLYVFLERRVTRAAP